MPMSVIANNIIKGPLDAHEFHASDRSVGGRVYGPCGGPVDRFVQRFFLYLVLKKNGVCMQLYPFGKPWTLYQPSHFPNLFE